MDSEDVKKRYVNDVVPPKSAPSTPLVEPVKRQAIMVADGTEVPIDPLLAPSEFTVETAQSSEPETNVVVDEPAPESEAAPEPAEAPVVVTHEAPTIEPLPESTVAESISTEPETPEVPDKDEPVKENYDAIDALPDSSQRLSADVKEGMQDPKIYDTTAYHVAINETHHTHGHARAALIVGVLFAVVVVGTAVFILVKIGS